MICPKCGSSQVGTSFKFYTTIYICGSCGHTWKVMNITPLLVGSAIILLVVWFLWRKF